MRSRGTSSAARANPNQLSFELSVGAETTTSHGGPREALEYTEVVHAPATGGQGAHRAKTPSTIFIGARAYPHIYDESAEEGAAMSLVSRAKESASAALQAFEDADLQAASANLGLVAATCSAAHAQVTFNRPLAAVISHVRRAMLGANVTEIQLGQLMQLVRVLSKLHQTPMLTLDEATDLVDDLESAGWEGAHPDVAVIVEALLRPDEAEPAMNGGSESPENQIQRQL